MDIETGYTSKYLTHYVGRDKEPGAQFKRLCKIIDDGCLLQKGDEKRAAGNVEIDFDVPFSSDDMLQAEIVCFCDIPLKPELLRIHTKKYSQFGIAFDKKWMAERGANPVIYLAKGASCTDHHFPTKHPLRGTNRKDFFDLAVGDWFAEVMHQRLVNKKDASQWPRMDNLLFWYLLCYCKFFDEGLKENNPDNYYMEREWRTVGEVKFSHDDIACIVLPRKYKKKYSAKFPNLKDKIFIL